MNDQESFLSVIIRNCNPAMSWACCGWCQQWRIVPYNVKVGAYRMNFKLVCDHCVKERLQ